MKEKHLIDKFLEFEEENDLFDLEIRGIKIWAHLRFGVYSQIISKKENLKRAHKKLNRIKKITGYTWNFLNTIIFHNPLLGLKKSDFILFNHSRRIEVDDIWEEPYSERFCQGKEKFYIFELPYYGEHKKNVLVKNNRKYLDLINLLSTSLAKIIMKIKPLNRKEIKIINSLKILIEKNFNTQIDLTSINYNIFYFYVYKKLLIYIIDKSKPKKIYQVVHYSFTCLLINQIAKERNIPTYEFQHGTMGKYHIAYNYKSNKKKSWLPDNVLFYNDFWKNNNRLPLKDKNKIIYGNPYLEAMKKKFQVKKTNTMTTILIISQGPIGKKLAVFAKELCNKLDDVNYRIIFKLHPSETDNWRKDYPGLLEKNIEVYSNEKHLYELFSQADIQIGVSSTAIYEGLEFNLNTYIFKTTSWEYMIPLIEQKKAVLISKVEDILDKI